MHIMCINTYRVNNKDILLFCETKWKDLGEGSVLISILCTYIYALHINSLTCEINTISKALTLNIYNSEFKATIIER